MEICQAKQELESKYDMQVISIIDLDTLISYSESNSNYEKYVEKLQAYRNQWGA